MADNSERYYPNDYPGNSPTVERGITVRDWYAGQIMCAMMTRFYYDPARHSTVAAEAVAAANALVAARDADNGG